MRTLLVGQAPGPRTDPEEPLSGRCGERLADLCGVDVGAFLALFRRVNLIDSFPGKLAKGDAFPIDAARRGAIDLLMTGSFRASRVVLLGGNVARTFGFKLGSYQLLRFLPSGCAPEGIALCPHPSGVSRWWNDPANAMAARRFWRRLALDALAEELRP